MSSKKTSGGAPRSAFIILFDVLLCSASLLVFAWFHHAKPQKFAPQALATPMPTAVPTAAPTPEPSPTAELHGQTIEPALSAAPTSEPTPTPTPEPTGLLGAKYADKFTESGVIKTADGYSSPNVCIELTRVSTKLNGLDTAYVIADIYIRDISSLRTYVSEAEDNKEWVVDMANANGAILATSGDYFMFKKTGFIIRNGLLYRDKPSSSHDICVLYYDGTVETFRKSEFSSGIVFDKMPYQAWSFGPKLMENGQPIMEGYNATDNVINYNPRCAFGYYEPGHYCLVVVDGRQKGYSQGMTMQQLATLMYDLGCAEAYNMDGGMTAMMCYDGELVTQPCGGGRKNCDIIYICEPGE